VGEESCRAGAARLGGVKLGQRQEGERVGRKRAEWAVGVE